MEQIADEVFTSKVNFSRYTPRYRAVTEFKHDNYGYGKQQNSK